MDDEAPAGGPQEPLWVRVEIPRGSRNKYEYDEAARELRLDRTLRSSVHYPTDYGYIPGTRTPAGDQLDVLVVAWEPAVPTSLVPVRVVGLLEMRDEQGPDDKVLAVSASDPRFDGVNELGDLPGHWLREIEVFFATYKLLEEKEVEVGAWRDRAAAWEAIRRGRAAYAQAEGARP